VSDVTFTTTAPPALGDDRRPDAAARSVRDRGRYLTGLDGVRALAVSAILIGHLNVTSIRLYWLRGGRLGVSTFFVLSGFLITRGLLHEREITGRTSLSHFWMRRARRLLPALYLGLLGSMLIAMLRFSPPDNRVGAQFISTLFYVKNWWLLSFGGTSGPILDQYWSLSIEEQFYLVFPIVFLLATRILGRRWSVASFAALALASYTFCYLASRRGNWEVAYFATPSRMCEILAGVVLSCVVASASFESIARRSWFTPATQVAGAVGLVTLLTLWHVQDLQWTTFHRTIPINVLATCLLIVSCLTLGPVSSLLSLRPLRWLGRISYGAYLYHVAIYFVVDGSRLHVHNALVLNVVRIGLTLVVADLSFRFVEQPLRRRTTPTGGRFVVAYGAPAVLILILALTLPFPAPVHPAPAVSTTGFTVTDAKAGRSATRVTVVGDELAQASLPGLHQLVAADPRRTWVSVHTAADCPIGVSRAMSLGGKVVAPDSKCRWLWFSLAAMLPNERPDTLVLVMGVSDLADHTLANRTWGHLGEAAADLEEAAALQRLALSLDRRHIAHVVWYALPVETAVRTYLANSAAAKQAAPVAWTGAPPPAAPTVGELRRRAARLTELLREVAARHPGIEVRTLPTDPGVALRPFTAGVAASTSLLGRADWGALLRAR
jgi:peptidoglycan/LPS O-acetylase OafA/YrhL